MKNNVTKSFCDTDFLINFNLSDYNLFDRFQDIQDSIYISDVVNRELEGFLKNKPNYQYIHNNILRCNKVEIISMNHIDKKFHSSIKAALKLIGIKTAFDKNAGEHYSVIYSYYYNDVKAFRTRDYQFLGTVYDRKEGIYKDITYLTMNETIKEIITHKESFDDIIENIDNNNNEMNSKSSATLEDLYVKFNSHRPVS